MKAIQIKYLPATYYKPARLKAWTEAGQLIEQINYRYDLNHHAHDLACRYIKKMEWNVNIQGFGILPNGDYVATLREYQCA